VAGQEEMGNYSLRKRGGYHGGWWTLQKKGGNDYGARCWPMYEGGETGCIEMISDSWTA
jgi:hypothetical protein